MRIIGLIIIIYTMCALVYGASIRQPIRIQNIVSVTTTTINLNYDNLQDYDANLWSNCIVQLLFNTNSSTYEDSGLYGTNVFSISGATWFATTNNATYGTNGLVLSDNTDDYLVRTNLDAWATCTNGYAIELSFNANPLGEKYLFNKNAVGAGFVGLVYYFNATTNSGNFYYDTTLRSFDTLKFYYDRQAGKFYHIVAQYDYLQGASVWINGLLYTNTPSITGKVDVTAGSTFIGGYQGTSGSYNYGGKYDTFRLYNRILTPAEITNNYNHATNRSF